MRLVIVAAVSSVAIAAARAQPTPVAGGEVTRTELQALVARLEAGTVGGKDPRRRGEALAALRLRLTEGDFRPGDRILLTVLNEPALTDTFSVLAGRSLALPGMPALPLGGILRSELHDRVVAHVGRLIRDPQVTVRSLTRVSVIGAVTRPGYYAIAPDALLSDALMLAGGPTGEADMQKAVVFRRAREFLPRDATRDALASGLTLDQIGIEAGDELFVPERRRAGATVVLTSAALLATTITGIITLSRH